MLKAPETTSPPMKLRPAVTIGFGSFRLDPGSGQLWRGDEVIHLRPKTWDVLCLLIANPGRLLSKGDIIAAVWDGAAVGDTMPSISIAELRRALSDDARNPVFVETVHGRGFRFIAPLQQAPPTVDLENPPSAPTNDRPFVGRGAELATLEEWLAQRDPSCRLALICGEAGIGKTTLVDELVRRIGNRANAGGERNPRPLPVGRGQSLAHFGDEYPYWPILGALRELSASRADAVELLRSVAPSWLARLPTVVPTAELAELRRRVEATPAARSLEEILAFLRELGPAVWILEDLHWADGATLELMALVADETSLPDFRIVGTLRPGEIGAGPQPIARIRRELRRRGRCREITLPGLGKVDVDTYLDRRFPKTSFPTDLASRLLARTNGNPFFLEHTIQHLEAAGALMTTGRWSREQEESLAAALDAVPSTLRELVQEEISSLSPEERQALGAASVAGLEFDAATVAAAIAAPVAAIDAICTELARRTALIVRHGESVWPDQTVSGRYGFRHALYQKVLYEDQPPAIRREAHCRIGERMVTAFGDRTGDVAGVLASHFERGGDSERAVSYHQLAADVSIGSQAAREAALHLRRALTLLPGVADRERREEVILSRLGTVLPALRGFGDPELLSLYMRVRTLQAAGSSAGPDFVTMAGSLLANLMQRKPQPAEELAREMLEIGATDPDPRSRAYAELLMGAVLYHQGDVAGTIEHAERSLALAPPGLTLGPIEHRCTAMSLSGAALWQAGRVDEGRARSQQAVSIARGNEVDRFNRVISLQPHVAIHHWCGDVAGSLLLARELGEAIEEQGITQAEACSLLIESWALLERGERALAEQKVERGVTALRRHGSMMQSVYLLTVAAEVFIGLLRWQDAIDALAEADTLIGGGAACWWEPEIDRWRAELCLQGHPARSGDDAEALLRRSLDLSSQQGSSSLTLRATITLARLKGHRRQRTDARERLTAALAAVTDGSESRDIREARRLLEGTPH